MSNIDIQFATEFSPIPNERELRLWCDCALSENNKEADITLRIVDADEIQQLNRDYRNKDKATNVLSFPSELPPELEHELNILGDVVLCAQVIEQEAIEQGKSDTAHWAHMVVHGTLHLQGYDHIENADAEEMESKESQILMALGFKQPYEECHSN